LDKLDEFITLARRTAALVAVAVLVAASVLYFFSYRKVPERNFLELLPSPKHPEYRFYTGSAGGRFVELGACIDKYDEKADEGFTIQTVPSTGSPENTLMVATTRSAFGLVESGAIYKKGWISDRLQALAPVSLEKMQVLYNVGKWQTFRAQYLAPTPKAADAASAVSAVEDAPRFSRTPTAMTKAFLSQAVVHAGPSGSGTRLMESYVLNDCSVQPKKTISGEFARELEDVGKGEADVAFLFSDPLPAVAQLIDRGGVALASVDPSLVPLLLKDLEVSVEPATLSRKQVASAPACNGVETLGAYAWLVASKDVPARDIAAVVRRAAQCVGDESKASDWESNGDMARNLENIAAGFDERADEKRRELWAALGEFGLTVVALSGGLYFWLGWMLSATYRSATMRRYMVLRDEVSRSVDMNSPAKSISHEKLEHIAAETKGLLEKVQRDCAKGLLLVRHRDGLTAILEDLERRFMSVCRVYVRRMSTERGGTPDDLRMAMAARWFALGYIDAEEYDRLVQVSSRPVQIGTAPT
jgi:TRAP-type uncharacterized transport system substrate-binding protein